jgi:hypothetical protein
MNWDAVGAIAELLGAIGVIASLVYLATQIRQSREQLRQNTATVRAASAAAHTQALANFNTLMAENPDVNRVFWAGLADSEGLAEPDRRRFESLVSLLVKAVEQSWRFHQDGILDDASWAEERATVEWLAREPGFEDFWKRYRGMINQEFVALVEEILGEGAEGE